VPEAHQTKLSAEDQKLVTLARSARARLGAEEGAAVRDSEGRTYVAGTVTLPSFQLTAIQAAVAAAISSGAEALEAAVVVSGDPLLKEASVNAVRDLGPAAPIYLVDPDGSVLQLVR